MEGVKNEKRTYCEPYQLMGNGYIKTHLGPKMFVGNIFK